MKAMVLNQFNRPLQWQEVPDPEFGPHDVVDVVRLVEDGKMKPPVSERFPLEQAKEALASLRENAPVGRIVLT